MDIQEIVFELNIEYAIILFYFSDNGAVTDISDSTNLANNSQCVSKFDFTRIGKTMF